MTHIPTALITWASSGIWRELARIHAQHGNLVITARREEKLHELQQELQEKHSISVTVIVQDLAQSDAARKIYDTVQNQWLSIDYLINNAWFGLQWLFHEQDRSTLHNMITVNMTALTHLTRLYVQQFVGRGHGKILNVSSTASFVPWPLQAVYFATKAYVQSLSNAIAYELRDTPITVTNMMPGATDTEFASSSGLEETDLFAQAVSAQHVAKDWYQAMLEGKMDVISWLPRYFKILTKLSPLLPKTLILKQMYDLQNK